ncbi:insulin-like 5a [Megalobrama amblycephala]|uniref:insulin-like 5a n=1 Tax=Megalobrama amblycephala TaxID=75352 RepID=UPI002013CA26|nr:insulin-like 5a [Megalobrama amblycephala]
MRRLYSPAVLLPVLLLCAVCSVSVMQADVRAVKLCGREFIRAVVYTCGGSRWRRFSSPQDMEGFFNGDLSSSEDLSQSLGSDLTRRDLNHDCCQFGCKKSDLTLLC